MRNLFSDVLIAVLVAVLSGFGLVACDGDGAPEPLTADELRERATAICEAGREAATGVLPTGDASSTEVADGLIRIADLVRDTADRLDDLEPPADLEDRWGTWVDTQLAAADALEGVGTAIRAGNRAAADQSTRLAAERSGDADGLAGELGIPECRLPAAPG